MFKEYLQDKYKTLNIKKPNWAKFLTHVVRNHNLNLVRDLLAGQQMHKFYATCETAAEVSILKAIIRKFYPKSWWSKELTEARYTSETLCGIHQKKKNIWNLISWKQARAKFKSLKIKTKEISRKYTSTINRSTPKGEIWTKFQNINKKDYKKTTILGENGVKYTSELDIANEIAEKTNRKFKPSNLRHWIPKEKTARRTKEAEH